MCALETIHPAAPARLRDLFHHRWTVPVLAEVVRQRETTGGARTAVLRARLGLSRSSLRRILAHLVGERGWLEENPGYGHPLRPELLLAKDAVALARWAGLWCATAEKVGAEETATRKWTAAVLAAAGGRGGTARFGELLADLPGATPRALSLALKDLVGAGLLSRREIGGFPPAVEYRPTAAGRRLVAVAARLPAADGAPGGGGQVPSGEKYASQVSSRRARASGRGRTE